MLNSQQKPHLHLLKPLLLVAIFTTIFLGNVKPTSAKVNLESICSDVEFIFARGSKAGEVDSTDTEAWRESFESQSLLRNLKINFYNLGEGNYDGASYPAAEIGFTSLDSIATTLSAILPFENLGTFNNSVNKGVTELLGRIRTISKTCPNTKFVLGGYSQGAMVLGRAFTKLDGNKIIFAATFGDPNLYLPEGKGINPPACRNESFSSYRIYAPNCRTNEGLLGKRSPYETRNLTGKVGLFCNPHDIMCSKYLDISDPLGDHISYTSGGIYDRAAKYILQKIAENFPDKIKSAEVETVSPLHARDTAFLIDTTSSMEKSIESYLKEAKNLAKSTIENGGRIALYEYRDLEADGKDLTPRELCDFSCSYEEFLDHLENLVTNGGGDRPESVLSASFKVMNRLSWQKGATKSIVLLTDAPYHNPDLDNTTFSEVVQRSLEIDPVNFYVITTPDEAANYAELTTKTSGAIFKLGTDDITTSTSEILNRPSLNLESERYITYVGSPLTFILKTNATASYYEWDLDFDGIFETKTSLPIVTKNYSDTTSGFIQAKIITNTGLSSTASAGVFVLPLEDSDLPTIELKIEGDGKGSTIPVAKTEIIPKTTPKTPNTGSPRR
ncbi:cutinase family protein [Candidatus Saccharibacteria bacterium]|nr:cutinase family protein [Candidatus Saccharibacteria bacterium]